MLAVAVQLDLRRFLAIVAAVFRARWDLALATGVRAFVLLNGFSHRSPPWRDYAPGSAVSANDSTRASSAAATDEVNVEQGAYGAWCAGSALVLVPTVLDVLRCMRCFGAQTPSTRTSHLSTTRTKHHLHTLGTTPTLGTSTEAPRHLRHTRHPALCYTAHSPYFSASHSMPSSLGGAMYPASADAATTDGLAR